MFGNPPNYSNFLLLKQEAIIFENYSKFFELLEHYVNPSGSSIYSFNWSSAVQEVVLLVFPSLEENKTNKSLTKSIFRRIWREKNGSEINVNGSFNRNFYNYCMVCFADV